MGPGSKLTTHPWWDLSTSGRARFVTNTTQCNELEDEEIEDTFVIDRDPDGPDSRGDVTEVKLRHLPEDLVEQIATFLKAVRKVRPESIPDKRKRDEIARSAQPEPGTADQEDSDLPTKRLKIASSSSEPMGPEAVLTMKPPSINNHSNHPAPAASCETGRTPCSQVVSRVIPEVRGHTSYLTFAIKLPVRKN